MFLTAFRFQQYYHKQYGAQKQWQTTVGLIYQGRNGSPYSIYMYGDVNEDGSNGNDLMFIPTESQLEKMKFVDAKVANPTSYPILVNAFGREAVEANTYTNKRGISEMNLSAEQQRTLLNYWISNDSYLSEHRGEYFKRNADNLAFEHHFDVHFGQKYSFKVNGQINSLELTFDIINIGNLLNKDWGHTYGDGFGIYYSPFNYQGDGIYKFDGTYSARNYSDYYSRWRGPIGLKYTF